MVNAAGRSAGAGVSVWRLFAIEFHRDGLLLRSSALAYSTLMSLVPVFAIVLAILSGPAFMETREAVIDKLAQMLVPDTAIGTEEWLLGDDSAQDDLKRKFRETIVPLAEKAGAVSVFGFLLLVVMAGFLFRTVEGAFNTIWRAEVQRPFFLRVAIATGLVFWGPVLLAVSVSLTEKLSHYVLLGTFLLPALFTTLAFTGFYLIMPHAKVRFVCALAGGFTAAVCWEVAKHGFLVYITYVVDYNKIYGSLGLIPMLFLWVYVNWLLVLCGAECAYCLQFREALAQQWQTAQQKPDAREAPPPPGLLLAVAIEIARHFRKSGCGGVRATQLADDLKVEPGQAREAAQRLVARQILVRVAGPEDGDPAYLPASELRSCNVSSVLKAAREEMLAGDGAAWTRARAVLAELARVSDERFQQITLADLADENAALPGPR